MRLAPLALALGLGLAALPAVADAPPTDPGHPELATLIADTVRQHGKGILVAEGHVEVFYKGTRLKAEKITYDQTKGTINVEGPLVLVDNLGRSTLVADGADLSADLQNGILRSAKMVLDNKTEIAAQDARRVDGRYTQLSRAVTSACVVCSANPRPLWEIRASRVIHDEADQSIYFQNAQLRFFGVPVFYLPTLRLPDPSVKRARGFLVPRVSSSTTFGLGVEVPYFLPFGPSRDLTVFPYFASKNATTLGLRYRQAFTNGALEFRGAASRDKIQPGQTRGYLFGDGYFNLPHGFTLKFQLQTVSDPDYFVNYGLSQVDRLESGLELTRTRRDEYIDAELLHFHSIRSGESNATLPTQVAIGQWDRRFTLPGVGGQARLSFRGLALIRTSNADILGRDVSRAGAAFNWRRSWVLPGGMVLDGITSLQGDLYRIRQDSGYPSTIGRAVPQAAVQLSWPWVRQGAGGAAEVIQPVVQLIWSPKSLTAVPNEDSQVSDFDEGNLFSLSHFNGVDGVELGARANLGLIYSRYTPNGWTLNAAAGRIFRQVAPIGFDTASGLGGKETGWLVALQAKWRGWEVTNRAVLSNGRGGITKDELRMSYGQGPYWAGSSYVWMTADSNASYQPLTALPTREWILDAGFPIYRNWTAKTAFRYDFVANRAESQGLAVGWHNECVSLDLSLSRSYASSTSVAPTTTFGFSVGLTGFGGGTAGSPDIGNCRR